MVARSLAIPVLKKWRQGNAWGSVTSQPSIFGDYLASEKDLVPKQKGGKGSRQVKSVLHTSYYVIDTQTLQSLSYRQLSRELVPSYHCR